jgi:hypothetical protein
MNISNFAAPTESHKRDVSRSLAIDQFGLRSSVDKMKRDPEGNTELMWLTANAPLAWMAQYVQARGNQAGLNAQNWKGQTALYLATSLGAKDKVEFLLKSGAVDYPTVEGVTSLHVAAAMGHCDIATLLVQHGSFVNAQDDEGDLPLHWAVREGNVDMVRLLVKLGTNYHSPNADGEDPLQLASCLDDEAVQEALAEAIEEYQEERDATFEDAARSPMELDGHSLLDVQFAKLFRETTAERDAKIPPAFRPRGVC